jgi:hypothetical protein
MGIPDLHRQEPSEHEKELDNAYKALIVGALYLGAVSINQYVIITLLGSLQASQEYVDLHAGAVVFATSLTHLLGVSAAAILILSAGDGTLRSALHRPRLLLLLSIALATAISSLLLNGTGVWPFAWRWEFDSNVALVRALITGRHIIALVYWLGLYGLGVPILEEVIFRFGILRIVRNWTGPIPQPSRQVLCCSVSFISDIPLGPQTWRTSGMLRVRCCSASYSLLLSSGRKGVFQARLSCIPR